MVPRNEPTERSVDRLRQQMLAILYPALAALPPRDREAALRRARAVDFDFLEWTGILGGMGLVAWLLQFDLPLSGASAPLAVLLLQFPLALVLLAAIVGPLYLRRTRRGLEREINQRHWRQGSS